MFAFGLIFANSIWEDTSEILVINETVDNVDYLASTTSFIPGQNQRIIEYLPFDDSVESFDLSLMTTAIYNSNDLPGNYTYYPLDNQQDPSNPVSISNSLLTNLTAMETLSNVLDIRGRIPQNSNEFMLSEDLAVDLEEKYNMEIEPNTVMNISIGKRFPFTDGGEFDLVHFDRNIFNNVTVTGLFEHNGAASISRDIYTTSVFKKLLIFPITSQTFSITDLAIMDSNSIIANLMINFYKQDLIDVGIEGLEDFLFDFGERIGSRFFFSITSVLGTTVVELNSEFLFSFNSAYLYYPLILLSLLLSHFTIGQLIQGREDQFNMLRQRGANDFDLIKLLAIEFFLIALAGIIVGAPLSILFAALIPALRPNGGIDTEIVELFLRTMQINLSEVYEIFLIIGGIYLASIIYHTFNLIINSRNNPDQIEKINSVTDLIKSGILIIFVSLLIFAIFEVEQDTGFSAQAFNRGLERKLSQAILILSITWLLFSQFLGDALVWILGKFDILYKSFVPKINYFVKRNFKSRNKGTKLFAFYLIFLFSLIIFSSSLYSTYDNYISEEERFLNGAPLRIHTSRTDSTFADSLSNISGVKQVTPIFGAIGFIASTEYQIYAVDPQSYLEVGYWEGANGSAPIRELLMRLEENPESMLISQQMSDRLGLITGSEVLVTSFQGEYASRFDISGILNSAPGLGLSGFRNPELSQYTRGWVMISLDYAESRFENLDPVELFLASTEENADIEQTANTIKEIEAVDLVNPKPINQNFVGRFVNRFLPFPRAILLFSGVITLFISVIMLILMTDFILDERKREYALLIAIGGKRSKVTSLINSEFLIISIFSMIIGIGYGILISKLSMLFFIPFTLKKIVVPLQYVVNPILVAIIFALFLVEILLVLQYSRRRILPTDITNILLERE